MSRDELFTDSGDLSRDRSAHHVPGRRDRRRTALTHVPAAASDHRSLGGIRVMVENARPRRELRPGSGVQMIE